MRAFQIYIFLLIGAAALAEPPLETPIMDRWISNKATIDEQKGVLRELSVFLEYANSTGYKTSLLGVVEKMTGYVQEEKFGGALGRQARINLQGIYKNSTNPEAVLNFLSVTLEFFKKEKPEDLEKLKFVKKLIWEMQFARVDFIHMKELLEEEFFMKVQPMGIGNEELLEALGVKIRVETVPIIDQLIANRAKDSEKKSIFFQVKTLIAYNHAHLKYNLHLGIRRGFLFLTFTDEHVKDAQDVLHKLYKESENPQQFLEFLEICLYFLRKREPEDSWKWLFFHGAVFQMSNGKSLEEMKKALVDGTWKLPEEVLKALGIGNTVEGTTSDPSDGSPVEEPIPEDQGIPEDTGLGGEEGNTWGEPGEEDNSWIPGNDYDPQPREDVASK